MSIDDKDTPANRLAAYALGALDLDELAAVERDLALHPESQEELRQLREVVALLPYAAPAVAPPDHVRDRLFARIATAQTAAPPSAATTPAPATPPRRAQRARSWFSPLVLTALIIVVAGLSVLTLTLQRSIAELDRTNRELVATLAQMQQTLGTTLDRQEALSDQLNISREQLDALQRELARERYVISFVAAPGVATRELNAIQTDVDARGEMYMYPGNDRAVVLFSGLKPLDSDHVYQFWLTDGSAQITGGTFKVDESGLATLLVDAPREVNAFSQVMVTVEPVGGSNTPGADVILSGSL